MPESKEKIEVNIESSLDIDGEAARVFHVFVQGEMGVNYEAELAEILHNHAVEYMAGL